MNQKHIENAESDDESEDVGQFHVESSKHIDLGEKNLGFFGEFLGLNVGLKERKGLHNVKDKAKF